MARSLPQLLASLALTATMAVAADGVCEVTPSKLLTDCGGVCDQYMPCSVYNASDSCSGCLDGSGSGSEGSECSYFCFTPYEDSDKELIFFIPFGDYESEEEEAARAADSGYDDEINSFTEDYTNYAYSGNNIMSAMGALDLDPATETFMLIGGKSSTGSLKSKVSYMTFDEGFLTSMTGITTVVMRNLNLKSQADQVGELLPAAVSNLTLVNMLMYSFPTAISTFSSLMTLMMDKNYITSVGADCTSNSLKALTLSDNNISSFEAVFPSVETLDLSNNYLTEIPSSIFEFSSLSTLMLSGNPLTNVTFTADQIVFLQNLTSLELTNSDIVDGLPCSSINYVVVHSVTLCQSTSTEASRPSDGSTQSSGSTDTGVIIGGVVGGVAALGLIALAVFCCYRRRAKLKGEKKTAETPAPPGYMFAPGTSRTLLAASGISEHASGIMSLWLDSDLLAVQVKDDDIEDLRRIGAGAFGEVWLVRYRNSQLLASKRLRKDLLNRERTMAFVEEIKLMATLDHPKIVRFVGAAWSIESDLQALSEYMENGDLRSYLAEPSTNRSWTALKLQLAIDIAEGLVYVHSFIPPLVHRDLKSRNVLLSSDMQAKLTDFGSTRYASEDNTMTQGVGTGRWLAPEVLAGTQDYDQAADVYSFGVVLSELDTHVIPYDNARGPNGNALVEVAVLQMVALGQIRPNFGEDCPSEIRELAERCMAQDPKDRPAAPEVAYSLRTTLKALFLDSAFV